MWCEVNWIIQCVACSECGHVKQNWAALSLYTSSDVMWCDVMWGDVMWCDVRRGELNYTVCCMQWVWTCETKLSSVIPIHGSSSPPKFSVLQSFFSTFISPIPLLNLEHFLILASQLHSLLNFHFSNYKWKMKKWNKKWNKRQKTEYRNTALNCYSSTLIESIF